MKAVILAGGLGSRLSEETDLKPKPMVEIGQKPILWHIMKIYGAFGIEDFIICLGYRGYLIKEYFSNYFLHMSNVTIEIKKNRTEVLSNTAENWRVTLVETGDDTKTGGRLKRIAPFLDSDPFCLTYGDGVADIDIGALIQFHQQHNTLATVTCVRPPGRFGALSIDGPLVTSFAEKPSGDNHWINGGFFVLSTKVLNYIAGDDTVWEQEPLERLAAERQLAAYYHRGFWQPMDTLRDRRHLEELWTRGAAPWKVWR